MSEDKKKAKVNFVTSFVGGARGGYQMSINNMMPYVLFAFTMIQILNLSGLSDLISTVCEPVMGVFGLPGIAATVVVAGLFSTGGGMGAAASLAVAGQIDSADAAILLVGVSMFGSCIQYMGRVLGAADVKNKYYPFLFAANVGTGFLAMFVTSFIVGR